MTVPQVKGLTDVIGQPAWQQGICFVPVIGEFCFTPPRYYLHEFADVSFLQKFMSLENEDAYLNDSLWVRARLIKVFGIHHLSGHAMRTLINFQGIALEWDHEMARPVWLTPFLISDTWNGYIDEFGPSTDSSIAFPAELDRELRKRISDTFWSLLLSKPYDLGVFVDYLVGDVTDDFILISCDGLKLHEKLLGFRNNETLDESLESPFSWWPFELPRKRRGHRVLRQCKQLAK